MRRPLTILVLVHALGLGACDKLPAAPDAKAFEAMSSEAKCEATLPRAKRCADELLVAEVKTLGGGANDELAGALQEDLADAPSRAGDAEAMHRNSCAGSRDDSYQRGVVRCWDVTPCQAFAECVFRPSPAKVR